MRLVTHTIVLLYTAALVGGCAARAARGFDATGSASAGTVVTEQELERRVNQGSIMDALQRLRPVWFHSRGGTTAVSVDGGPSTDVSILRMIPASAVREVRLERSTSSVGRATIAANGDVHVGGTLIVVTTKRGGGGTR